MLDRSGRRARNLQDESRVSSRLRHGLIHYAVSVPTGRIRGFGSEPQDSGIGERELSRLAAMAFDVHRRASEDFPSDVMVASAMPILYHGDRDSFASSPRRIVTVGLNPSQAEFPKGDPFTRFPLAAHLDRPSGAYYAALDMYFKTNPDEAWFSSLESLLGGMDASYYPGADSTALHTNLGLPLATDPAWSSLGPRTKRVLLEQGVPLWHDLVEILRPDVILMSVPRVLLERIEFESSEPFEISRLEDGRSRPYVTEGRWVVVGNRRSLLVFGQASNRPFGLVGDMHKAGVGGRIVTRLRDEKG